MLVLSKKEYSTPKLDITELEGDIITTSPPDEVNKDNESFEDDNWGQG